MSQNSSRHKGYNADSRFIVDFKVEAINKVTSLKELLHNKELEITIITNFGIITGYSPSKIKDKEHYQKPRLNELMGVLLKNVI